jgi:hypothetical protein
MNWFEYLFLIPIQALNNIRSNVWAVILIIVGIPLVLHGHENIGSSLITGAFAVFRSSNTDTAPIPSNAAASIQINAGEKD